MPRRVREPVQAYLDEADRALLEEVARRTGLARAEVLRRGLRTFAQQALAERAPGWAFESLIGAFGDDAAIPADLSERHDGYLTDALADEFRRAR
ncbi:MAG: hypothetical protein Q8Q14_02395 [Gemmatimonadales bacterium]|nr:hypothetical protein [Gemmatimonadales bacterium]